MVAVASVAVMSVVVLLQDPTGPLLESQNLPTSAEAGPLRAEAIAAATGAFERVELARVHGDQELLDGVFVPGSPAEAGYRAEASSRDQAAGQGAAALEAVPAAPVTSASVTLLTRSWASVRLEHAGPGGTVPYRVALRRVGDRWLVRDLVREVP